jgi:hypothetical protein
MWRGLRVLLLVAIAAPAIAQPPKTSLRPVARPAGVIVVQPDAPPTATAVTPADPRAQIRPQARPPGLAATAAAPRPAPRVTPAPTQVRETRAERRARERAERRAGRQGGGQAGVQGGGLCGDAGLVGEVFGAVPGPGACGIPNAVRLRAVSGVRLSTSATIDCNTAKALKRWVDRSVIPETDGRGGGVAELRVAASYACRGRNNQPGARLSEHASGRAIDISGLTLRDGTTLTVLQDWGSGRNGRLMKSLHRAACGPFGTVLGPNSDRFHRDHFHFDTARHRSGPYCK